MTTRQNNVRRTGRRSSRLFACLGLVATTALTAPALAADVNWTGDVSSDWSTSANWSNLVPTTPSAAVINGVTGKPGPVIGSGDVATPDSLSIGTDGTTATLSIEGGGTLTTNNWYDYIGGASGVTRALGSNGTVTVDGIGSRWTSAQGILVGYDGTGTLNISRGGEVRAVMFHVGRLDGGIGTVTVDGAGSKLVTPNYQSFVGYEGTGTLTISNGGAVEFDSIQIGTGKVGVITRAEGTLRIESGGTLTMSASVASYMGNRLGATGSAVVTGPGSRWSAGLLYVGNEGAGNVTVADGGVLTTGSDTMIAYLAGSSGSVTVEGTNSSWVSSGLIGVGVGDGAGAGSLANGQLSIGSGGTVSGTSIVVGWFAGASGRLVVDGANSAITASDYLEIGNVGDGTAIASNGGSIATTGGGTITIAYAAGSTGKLIIGGETTAAAAGSVSAGGGIIFGAGSGQLILNHTSDNYTLSSAISGTGSVLVKSGTTRLTGANSYTGGTTISGGKLIGTTTSLAGSIVDNTALVIDQETTGTFAGAISGTGSLEKTGTGTVTLSGANTYSGGTTITAGRLVGTTGSLTGNIVNNATLEINQDADGTFAGAISGTGNLVKSGTGTVTLTGTLTYTGTTTILGGHLIGNTAVIGGGVANDGVLEFEQTADGTYSSSITGTGSLVKTGTGTLVLTGSNTYSGGTTISGGTLVGSTTSLSGDVANQASLVFDQGSYGQFTGNIIGTGTLTKSGAGNLVLTGTNTYVGDTTVDAGRLSVNGSIAASIVEIKTGAELGGSGTVGGIVARSGSTLAPGNSIGTLSVSGNATLDNGSTYSVEVDATGRSDKLAATGTVTIGSGVTLLVTPENGTDTGATYALNTQYTIVTAQNGVTGTFATVTENFAYLTAAVTYSGDGKNVYLTLTRTSGTGSSFAGLVSAPNAKAAARAVDVLNTSGVIYQAATNLATGEPELAFARLSGEIHPSIAGALIDRSHLARDVIINRVRQAFGSVGATQAPAMPEERGHVWMSGFGAWGSYDGDGNGHSFDANGGGVLVGADAPFHDGWRFGLAAGYGHDRIDDKDVTSSGAVDSYYLAGYGGTSFGPAALRLGAIHAFQSISTDRTVAFSTLNEQLKADYDAGLSQVFAEGAWRYEVDALSIEPYANAAYVHLRTDAFGETGGAAALSSAAASYDQFYTTLGVRLEQPVDLGAAPARLTGGLGWRHAFGDVAPDTGLAFAGFNAFGVSAAAVAREAVLLDAGIAIDFNPTSSLSIRYNGMLADGFNEQAVAARLGVQF